MTNCVIASMATVPGNLPWTNFARPTTTADNRGLPGTMLTCWFERRVSGVPHTPGAARYSQP